MRTSIASWIRAVLFLALASCDVAAASPAVAVSTGARASAPLVIAIPGASAPLSFDYLVADRQAQRIYLPVPSSGALEVLDVARRTFRSVGGFSTGAGERHGRKRVTGPSSATVGQGVVYVGDQASSEVCAVDAASFVLGDCGKLKAPPDGVVFVASTREVWVTTPGSRSLTIVDVSDAAHPHESGSIAPGGEPEGYAVDDARGLFFTNLDNGTTLAIDTRSRRIQSIWHPGCDDQGARGLAVDSARGLLIVACTDHVQVLDIAHGGALRGRLDTGRGLDNLDYLPSQQLLVAAAGRAATLTLAHVGDGGDLALVASIPTAKGARNGVIDAAGRVYLPDPAAAALLVISSPGAARAK